MLGLAYAMKGMYPKAHVEYDKSSDQDKVTAAGNQFVAGMLGWVYAVSGRRTAALKIAREFKDLSAHAYVDFYWQSRAQVRRRSCGANLATPMRLADSFTMCQTAFTVIPAPHVLPTLLTLRNNFPLSIAAGMSHSSNSRLTQSGTGTVRTWPALPTRSTIAQCSSRCCK